MTKNASPGAPDKYICYKLSRVMRKVQRYYEVNLAPFEITPVQFYVLSALLWKDGAKFKDLAKMVGIDGSTLTGILDRMERGGFVERRDDPEDRRSLLVCLTEKSKQLGPRMVELAEKLDEEIKGQFYQHDFATFMKVLDKLGETAE